jgi:hypothetical protein
MVGLGQQPILRFKISDTMRAQALMAFDVEEYYRVHCPRAGSGDNSGDKQILVLLGFDVRGTIADLRWPAMISFHNMSLMPSKMAQ